MSATCGAGRRESATAAARWRCTSPERSEEHTSELQSPCNLVCRLLLEKKKRHRLSLRLSHDDLTHRSRLRPCSRNGKRLHPRPALPRRPHSTPSTRTLRP